MGFWASGDDSVPKGVAPSHYGDLPKPNADDPAVKDKYWAGYSSEKSYFGKDTEAARAFYDDRNSDAWKSRMRGDIAGIEGRTAPQAGATKIGPGGYTSAATVGPMATWAGAKADYGDSRAVSAQQSAEMSRLAAIASGAAPGAGVQQLYASADTAARARLAAAGSGPARLGGAAARRGLINAQDSAAQATAGQAAVVGAQEQQAAQSMLAGLSSSARAGAWDEASGQAALGQQAALWNAGQKNNAGLAQAGFQQQAGMFNASAAQKQYEMDQARQLSNMEAYLRSQGLNDQAIAARMGFMQEQMNRDKADRMAFWDYAAGGQRWDASRAYGLDAAATLRQNQQLAAAGQLGGMAAGAYGGGESKWDGSGMGGGGSGGSYEDASRAAGMVGGKY